jgi:hypothetical protein
MINSNLLAEQIGLLIIANCEQACLIQELQKQLSDKADSPAMTIPGYETDQEGQGPPPHLRSHLYPPNP